jgi:hypothetical protein
LAGNLYSGNKKKADFRSSVLEHYCVPHRPQSGNHSAIKVADSALLPDFETGPENGQSFFYAHFIGSLFSHPNSYLGLQKMYRKQINGNQMGSDKIELF